VRGGGKEREGGDLVVVEGGRQAESGGGYGCVGVVGGELFDSEDGLRDKGRDRGGC